jgi:hypothetical protein
MERKTDKDNENQLIKKNKKLSSNKINKTECALNNNMFDPMSCSPTNSFLLKIYSRLSTYYDEEELCIKDTNFATK